MATTSCCSALLRPLRPPLAAALHSPSPPKRFLPICSSSSKVLRTRVPRRLVSLSLVLFHFLSFDNGAMAGSIWDKYVKKKKLEPLDAYVPAVILSQSQLRDLETSLELDKPKYADCRSLLRSGPAASLRVNIRVVAQYASEDGKGKTASDSVDQCLRALEDLDSLLLRASRSDPSASVESMKAKINVAVLELDNLLQTVPSEVLDKAKAIADAYITPTTPLSEDEEGGARRSEKLDPDIKQLQELL
ncbi:uncharacterized protein LOC116261858 isoform X2 [Nymphaea colorata]|uniref:uncharacterized protein LOC116261858 isoform X2 n=1 Tax=Nymphaea colorata TaxID=210225 RepID=UPI00214F603C|nr:uncharacterized protein LOC116261858 isoform X2 [Nymphaea colorata]